MRHLQVLFNASTKYVYFLFSIFMFRFVSHHIDGQKYDIEFTFNRFPLRRQHYAVEEAFKYNMEPVLFPKSTKDQEPKEPLCQVKEDTSAFARQLFDRKLASNDEQIRAIQHIVKGSSRPAPYLIFGPPGTGKTVTMVEAIKQVCINRFKSDGVYILQIFLNWHTADDFYSPEQLSNS